MNSNVMRGRTPKAIIVLLFGAATLLSTLQTFAQTNDPSAESFLPKAEVTDSVYVEIERDPALDDYGQRIQAARAKNPDWFREYGSKHQTPGVAAPYHENFGVSKEEYERFSQPMNHFRELKRQEIKIRRSDTNGNVQIDFEGKDLLLKGVVMQTNDGSARTSTDVLPRGRFIDVEIASLPPGRHRGAHFTTPQSKIAQTKRRESLLVGELKDQKSGIIHYSINTPGQAKMCYIQFPK